MSEGWIKLYRGLVDWEWYNDMCTKSLFIHLLLTANHKPMRWRGKLVGRGQVLTSRAKLSTRTGLSERQIRTGLKRLKTTNEIAIDSSKKETVITICNYDSYQGSANTADQENGHQSDQRIVREPTEGRPTRDQATNKNGKNGKNENNSSSEPSAGPNDSKQADDPVFVSIPLNVKDAEFEVRQSLVEELQKLYPAVDVEQALRGIRAWNLSNPKNRKTESGIHRHINGWMSKEQNRGPRQNIADRNSQTNMKSDGTPLMM